MFNARHFQSVKMPLVRNSVTYTLFTPTYAAYSKVSPIPTTTSFATTLTVNTWPADARGNHKGWLECPRYAGYLPVTGD